MEIARSLTMSTKHVVASALFAASGLGAASASAQPPSPIVNVALQALSTPEDGPTGQTGSASSTISPGEAGTLNFSTDHELCSMSIGSIPHGEYAHSWNV